MRSEEFRSGHSVSLHGMLGTPNTGRQHTIIRPAQRFVLRSGKHLICTKHGGGLHFNFSSDFLPVNTRTGRDLFVWSLSSRLRFRALFWILKIALCLCAFSPVLSRSLFCVRNFVLVRLHVNSKERAARKGQSEHDIRNRTARTGQPD
jgi:hypothetical protein